VRRIKSKTHSSVPFHTIRKTVLSASCQITRCRCLIYKFVDTCEIHIRRFEATISASVSGISHRKIGTYCSNPSCDCVQRYRASSATPNTFASAITDALSRYAIQDPQSQCMNISPSGSFGKLLPSTAVAKLSSNISPLHHKTFNSYRTCFHFCTRAGMPSIACRLFSNLPFCVLSHSLPLTFCPIPVPFTRSPVSSLLRILSSVPLTENGSNSSTPFSLAILTRSA